MGQAPHAVRRPPCHSVASHTQAVSPYGIAVFPYGHTPDASPHTSWQIPIGRPFSHTPHQIPHSLAISPYGFRGSPYNPQTPKNSTPNSTRPAGPVPQIPNQPCQANILDLRHTSANQSPTGSGKSPALRSSKPSAGQFQQITHACDGGGGCRHLLHGYAHTCTYGHGHACTFTRMVTHAHGHGAQANPPRPASGFNRSSANPTHSNPLGGMGDDDAASTTTGGPAACLCWSGLRAGLVVEPEGSTIRPT